MFCIVMINFFPYMCTNEILFYFVQFWDTKVQKEIDLRQFKISPTFFSEIKWTENWTLRSALSLVTFFQWRDRGSGSTWAARLDTWSVRCRTRREDSGVPQWSQLAPWSGQPSHAPSHSVRYAAQGLSCPMPSRRRLLRTPVHDRWSQTAPLLFPSR